MPYPTGHLQQIRSRIVEGARRLFNRNGFESVSVDAIMAQAGLTRGAFYAYFESKSGLYAEILGCFFTDPNWRSLWEGVDVDLAFPDAGPQIVRAYLSQQHFDDVENSCPMVALPSDVARRSKGKGGVRECIQSNGDRPRPRRKEHDAADRRHRNGNCGALHRRHGRGTLTER
jgi:AcrR family transcriptional regulator